MSTSRTSRGFIGRWPMVAMLLVAIVAAVALFAPFGILELAEPSDPAADGTVGVVFDTASATVQNLESTFETEDANIVFVGEITITDPQQGTIGWIVGTETTVEPGDVLYERDDQAVTLMTGSVPAWRTMQVDDVGQDVAQLEANLLALGYGTEAEFTVDGTYTSATAAIVQRWQTDVGAEDTGSVAFGDVVFGPEQARVGVVSAAVGDTTGAGAPLFTLSSTERQLNFTVDAELIGTIATGTSISARLPDRSTVEGNIVAVAPAGSGISTVTAALNTNNDAPLPQGDSIPVTVSWADVVADEAVTIPAGAILRLDGGHYAVQVVSDDGDTTLTPIEVGAKVGSAVQVVSGLEPDDEVIAP
jgi:peptidoglycan hydrolase-like protein with peptidoglycan-binding domain